jgi:hypothetical protein
MGAYGFPLTKGFRERNCDFNSKPDAEKSHIWFEEQVSEMTREPDIRNNEYEASPARK